MHTLQEYKCPCCGGAVNFDSGQQKMVCPYCDTEFDIEVLKKSQSGGAFAELAKSILNSGGAAYGAAFNDLFEELFYNYVCVAIALIVFGIAFIIIETRNHGKSAKINSIAELDYKTVIIIGLFQLIAAIFPGTSRSGATIVGALLIGVSRVVAAEFTFYLAVPVMFGASLLKLVKFGFAFTTLEFFILMVGMIVAFITSMFVISFLMSYIKKHDFKVFGYYRIVLGILVLAYYFLFAIK